MHFQSVALSDRGLTREINEDSAWVGSQIIAVADGLGGHAGGAAEKRLSALGDAGAARWTLPQRPDHGALSPIWLAVHDCLTQ